MNVINGELRTAVELMKYYDIPLYRQQYWMYRIMNKLFPNRKFSVKYSRKELRNHIILSVYYTETLS